jgi:hypothetical protein
MSSSGGGLARVAGAPRCPGHAAPITVCLGAQWIVGLRDWIASAYTPIGASAGDASRGRSSPADWQTTPPRARTFVGPLSPRLEGGRPCLTRCSESAYGLYSPAMTQPLRLVSADVDVDPGGRGLARARRFAL